MVNNHQPSAYARAGVDIEAGNRAVDLMKTAVRGTYTPEVLSETGSFGGSVFHHATTCSNSPFPTGGRSYARIAYGLGPHGLTRRNRLARRRRGWDSP